MYFIFAAYKILCAVINAICCVYTNLKSFVSTQDEDTEAFAVNTVVLQSDTLTPLLLIIVFDYVLRQSMSQARLKKEENWAWG